MPWFPGSGKLGINVPYRIRLAIRNTHFGLYGVRTCVHDEVMHVDGYCGTQKWPKSKYIPPWKCISTEIFLGFGTLIARTLITCGTFFWLKKCPRGGKKIWKNTNVRGHYFWMIPKGSFKINFPPHSRFSHIFYPPPPWDIRLFHCTRLRRCEINVPIFKIARTSQYRFENARGHSGYQNFYLSHSTRTFAWAHCTKLWRC